MDKDTLIHEPESIAGEVLKNVLGNLTVGMFVSAAIFSLIGIFIGLLLGAMNRNPHSPRTPYKFNIGFLLSDNAIRIYKSIALTILVLFVSIRFAQNLIGQKASMFYALCLGLAIDAVVDRWRDIRNKFGEMFKGKETKSNFEEKKEEL